MFLPHQLWCAMGPCLHRGFCWPCLLLLAFLYDFVVPVSFGFLSDICMTCACRVQVDAQQPAWIPLHCLGIVARYLPHQPWFAMRPCLHWGSAVPLVFLEFVSGCGQSIAWILAGFDAQQSSSPTAEPLTASAGCLPHQQWWGRACTCHVGLIISDPKP